MTTVTDRTRSRTAARVTATEQTIDYDFGIHETGSVYVHLDLWVAATAPNLKARAAIPGGRP